MEEQALLVADNVEKSFHTAAGQLDVLRGVSLTMAAGEALAITGPSGCGKSTFLSIIGALDQPSHGSVVVNGENLAAMDEQARSLFRNQTVGFVFQDHHLLPQCSVLENVLIPILATRSANEADRNRATGLLEKVNLADRANHLPGQLSGGERQRAALCRALVNEPKLLLADEPTGNLDPATAGTIGKLLLEIGPSTGAALICVTHSLDLAGQFPEHMRLVDGSVVS